MLWFWLLIGFLVLSFVYVILVRSNARHILVGLVLALAIFAIVGSLYLLFTGKLQWLWLTASGLVPWVSRWFYLRRLLNRWQQQAVSKISSEHLEITIPQNQPNTVTSGTILKNISLEKSSGDHLPIQASTDLADLDKNTLEQLQNYFQQHDSKAFQLLRFYGQSSGRFQSTYDASNDTANTNDIRAGKMNRLQALEVLGLSESNCSEELVIETHRRLIEKLHPDKGGSDYLASIINEARDVLQK